MIFQLFSMFISHVEILLLSYFLQSMGNIEGSDKTNLPDKAPTTEKSILSKMKPKKHCKTEIATVIHSTKLHCKAEFHRINPLGKTIQGSEEEVLPEDWPEEELLCKEQGEKSLLEGLMEAEGGKERIGVNWSLFLKIKRKNYLEEYAFVKELGKGAFGSVAKVKMKYGGQVRAVKIIKETASLKEEANRKKLLAEISIPSELDHPNIAKLYQVFEQKGTLALVMELCEGGDLFTFIRSNRIFSESSAATLLKQIISAVYYMHKKGVCHRDLKPQNMLYDTESGLLKIIDFGTATHFKPSQKFSQLTGTPYYVAPQVLNGSYDSKCDIWSVGVILYVILSGAPPFSGKNEREIMDKIKIQPLEFTSPIWAKRSSQCKELIANMLSKDPQTRMNAEQVLNSSWIERSKKTSGINDPQLGKQIVSNLKNFHFQNKLKAVVYTYIASQLYSNKDKELLLKAFHEIDRDGDGVIERDELIRVFNDSHTNLQQDEVERILQLIDTNGSGRIDFTEFLVAASNEQQLLKRKQLENAFSYLDTDHSGFITFQEVKAFLDGTQQTNEQIRQIFREVDDNGDGKISKNEFISLLIEKKEK